MGDSSISCCLTGHTIKSGGVVMIPIAPARYVEDGDRMLPSFPGGGKIFSNKGACAIFMPLTLPIFGYANYSHSIESIEKDENTKWLEKRLKVSIEDFVYAASNGGNIPQIDKIAKYVYDYEFVSKSRPRLEWDGRLRCCYIAREAWDIFSKDVIDEFGKSKAFSTGCSFWKMAQEMLRDMERSHEYESIKYNDKARFGRINIFGDDDLMKDINEDERKRVKACILKDGSYVGKKFETASPYTEVYCGYGCHVTVSANEIGGSVVCHNSIDRVDHKCTCKIDTSFVPKIKFTEDTWKLLDGVGITSKMINKPRLRSTASVPYIDLLSEEMVVIYRKVLMENWSVDRLAGVFNFIGNMSAVNKLFHPNITPYTYGNPYAEKQVAELSLKLAEGRIASRSSE